jgi:hypothetical protein
MSQTSEPKADRVAALAERLRLIQADLADQEADVRRGYLRDELQRALARVVPGERAAILEELQSRFPTWDEPAPSAPAQAQKDPEALLDALLNVWPTLPEVRKRQMADRLKKELGIAAPPPQAPAPAAGPTIDAAAVASVLQLGEAERLSGRHMAELLALLIEIICSLDQNIWGQWRQIAPQAAVKRPGALQPTMARFVAANPSTSRAQVREDVDRLRVMIVALVASVAQAGRFAVDNLKALAPHEIKALVGPSLVGAEKKYWLKYTELCESMDLNAVDTAVRRKVADYVERLVGLRE